MKINYEDDNGEITSVDVYDPKRIAEIKNCIHGINPIRKVKRQQSNKMWSEDEDRQLQILFRGGYSIYHMAKGIGRTKPAIKSRLYTLKLIGTKEEPTQQTGLQV